MQARLLSRRWRRLAAAAALAAAGAGSAWAVERRIGSTPHNHAEAPARIIRSEVTLIAPAGTPTKIVVTDKRAKTEDVYYLTREEAGYRVKGRLAFRNESRQTIELIRVTIVLLDRYFQAIEPPVEQEFSSRQRMSTLLPVGAERAFAWEHGVRSQSPLQFVEVAVVITAVQFADASVWAAPRDEVIDVF
jgi:hypothetical protein